MRTTLFASAALTAALLAAPASAATTGFVDGSWSALDDGWDGDKEGVWALGGAVASSMAGGWTVQFDGRQMDLDHGDHGHGFGAGVAHLYNRDAGRAFGAYGGLVDADENSMWTVGAEGALYFRNATLTGNLGYLQEHEDGCCATNGWTARGGAKVFLNDQTVVDVGLAYDDFDNSFEDVQGWVGGLGVEHQFSNPASVFAAYRHSDWDYALSGSKDVDSFTVGLRWNFGTADLKERDREGASMEGPAGLVRDLVDAWW